MATTTTAKRTMRTAVIALLAATAFMLVSCEKVITIDLHQANPRVVVEGIVSDRAQPASVTLTKTGNYFEPSLVFPPVTHALAVIADDAGHSDTLSETAPGSYLGSMLMQGIPGRTYTLRVDAEGSEYTAVSSMPKRVPIDSIYALPRLSRGEIGFDVYVMFRDPPEPGNFYRINVRASSQIPSDSIDGRRYRLYSDKLTNGNMMTERLRTRTAVHTGDTITVELQSIDRATYDFFNTLRDVLSSDRSPTSLSPANPNTNLNGGALGYFAAWSTDTRSIVLR